MAWVTRATADLYFTGQPTAKNTKWSGETTGQREDLLTVASNRLDALVFLDEDINASHSKYIDATLTSDPPIPQRLLNAVCELAFWYIDNPFDQIILEGEEEDRVALLPELRDLPFSIQSMVYPFMRYAPINVESARTDDVKDKQESGGMVYSPDPITIVTRSRPSTPSNGGGNGGGGGGLTLTDVRAQIAAYARANSQVQINDINLPPILRGLPGAFGTPGQVVKVNAGGDALEFGDDSGSEEAGPTLNENRAAVAAQPPKNVVALTRWNNASTWSSFQSIINHQFESAGIRLIQVDMTFRLTNTGSHVNGIKPLQWFRLEMGKVGSTGGTITQSFSPGGYEGFAFWNTLATGRDPLARKSWRYTFLHNFAAEESLQVNVGQRQAFATGGTFNFSVEWSMLTLNF